MIIILVACGGFYLWAAYATEKEDFSKKDIPILFIHGDKDYGMTEEKVQKALELLPEYSTYIVIKGGNHSQCGYYGFQKGDKNGTYC